MLLLQVTNVAMFHAMGRGGSTGFFIRDDMCLMCEGNLLTSGLSEGYSGGNVSLTTFSSSFLSKYLSIRPANLGRD